MVSMRWRTEGGPMPPNVVNTHGRKVRLRDIEPAACLLIFSVQRVAMIDGTGVDGSGGDVRGEEGATDGEVNGDR